ncbi:MAG TPA: ABC transporter permease [Candidatus Melainabacteria bacterium]|nr:ABC transporter permease [Candidatus Melainabacteria bacterium]HIN65460.1 ABC transporter permease [Candidatus Obscuribacterales bacterium]
MSKANSNFTMLKALFLKELRELAAARSFWVMLLVLCPLVGFSFVEAVFLYAHAGQSIIGDEILMARLSPLDGIVVPTFSAMYLSEVFLFPFVVIRMLGVEKQYGSIKLLLQISPSLVVPLVAKVMVAMLAFILSLAPALTALFVWHSLGGYLYVPEVVNLIFGHLLFALFVISIAFFAVAVTDSPQTAAIVTLAFTISSWVLEFAGQNQSTLNAVSWLSVTKHLRLFESGLFSLQTVLGFILASLFFTGLAGIWLKTGKDVIHKLKKSAVFSLVFAFAGLLASQALYFQDFSENRVNSFNPKNEAELRKINKPLKITIHLSPDDSLSVDFEQNFLSKLRRVVKDVTVVYVAPVETDGKQEDPKFGQILYDYNGIQMQSHDVGAPRALETLHMMTGTSLEGEVASPYPGHPLKADASNYRLLFYVIMPAFVVLSWFVCHKSMRKPRGIVISAEK